MSCQPGHPNDGPSVRPVHYYYEYGNEVKATNTSSCLLNEHTDIHTHSRFAYNSLTTTATTTTNRKPNAIASHWRSVFGSIDVWMNGIFVFITKKNRCNNKMLQQQQHAMVHAIMALFRKWQLPKSNNGGWCRVAAAAAVAIHPPTFAESSRVS